MNGKWTHTSTANYGFSIVIFWCKKLTFAGPGRKVLPTFKDVGQFNQRDIPSPKHTEYRDSGEQNLSCHSANTTIDTDIHETEKAEVTNL